MKKLTSLLTLIICVQISFAQSIIKRDPVIDAMVKEISADSLKANMYKLVSFGSRNTLSTQASASNGIGAASQWILSQFKAYGKQSNGRLTAFIDTVTYMPDGNRVNRPIILGNVVATLKGTDTNDHRVFIMSGHMDSRVTKVMDSISDAPGADDDGSGTIAVMECARVMSKYKFPATIIFVALTGEEQGLLGANFMAKKAKKEKWSIEAVLNNDIMGSNNSNETNIIENTKLRVFSEAFSVNDTGKTALQIRDMGLENDGRSRQLARYIKEIGERYVDNLQIVMVYRNDRFLRGGDHTPFVANGFAAVRFTEMNENYNRQHQDLRTENAISYGDTPEHIDFEYLRKNSGVNLSNLANLSKAPSVPEEVKIDVKNLTNTTYLFWKAPKTGVVKGYYILMRETTSAVWQKKFFTESLSMRLPYSKDNYFFAVQSVNDAGNESLPVMPSVGR
jgi:Zn-dependent M28 family amino/carboxypeptidase